MVVGQLGSVGALGRLGFRVGVSASYNYFRCVRNFEFVYTAAVSVPLAYFVILLCTFGVLVSVIATICTIVVTVV